MTKKLRLGLIGFSDGNGHPYSWSAIFNGYDKKLMECCGFPVIPKYLGKQVFPRDQLLTASVTHIWTQDPSLSIKVAKTCFIPNVSTSLEAMIGSVDAVLLARDDSENHRSFATPFLLSGIPVYIDKPIATTRSAAEHLLSLQRYRGQIFSCSALRFAPELDNIEERLMSIGQLRAVYGYISNSWDKYSVHIIDPLLASIDLRHPSNITAFQTSTSSAIHFSTDSIPSINLTTLGKVATLPGLRFYGSDGIHEVVFQDTFSAFRNSLAMFVDGVAHRKQVTPAEDLLTVASIIEMGRKAQ